MLNIWSTADTALLSKVFASPLQTFRPHVPEHRFVPFREESLVEPEFGDITLVCGTRPLEVLQANKIAPKNRKVTSLREKPILSAKGGYYLVTFDPYITKVEFDKADVMGWDLRLAVRLMNTGSIAPPVGDYKWVSDYGDMIAWIEARFEQTGKPVDVSTDTETMGLYPWYPDKDFVSIAFTARPNTSEMLYLGPHFEAEVEPDTSKPLFDQIKWLLTSPKVRLRMANGKYDLIWIKEKWGIDCTNFKFDTLLVGSLLNENRVNSLNLHAKLMTPLGAYDDAFNDSEDKGKMELIDPAKLRVYQGGDTDACQQVADTLRNELSQDAELTRFYVTILHPAARAFEKIERTGLLIDKDKYEQVGVDARKVIKESQDLQLSLLPNKMRIKFRERIEEQLADGKNPMLPSIIKAYFFSPDGLNLKPREITEKTGEPSTAKSHLQQFDDHPDAKAMVAAMTTGNKASKVLSTYVEGFLKHLRPDMRFHPSYMLFKGGFNDDADDESGTVTGRLAAKDCAIQTLPKKSLKGEIKWADRLRECFISPPGKKMINADYSQGELKVVACVANEKTMIQSYLDGLDLHAVTGAKLGNVDFKEFMSWSDSADKNLSSQYKSIRDRAKPANFGLLYGMSAEGFQGYCWAQYGIKLTLDEAEAMRAGFFELYPGLLVYHDQQRKLVEKQEYVRSPLGRIRHLPIIRSPDRKTRSSAGRMAINSPIQSTLNDMLLWAVALLDDAYPNREIETCATIHDALVAYVPEDDAEMWCGRIVEVMQNLPLDKFGWKPQLKFTADVEMGYDMAHLEKVKIAA